LWREKERGNQENEKRKDKRKGVMSEGNIEGIKEI